MPGGRRGVTGQWLRRIGDEVRLAAHAHHQRRAARPQLRARQVQPRCRAVPPGLAQAAGRQRVCERVGREWVPSQQRVLRSQPAPREGQEATVHVPVLPVCQQLV